MTRCVCVCVCVCVACLRQSITRRRKAKYVIERLREPAVLDPVHVRVHLCGGGGQTFVQIYQATASRPCPTHQSPRVSTGSVSRAPCPPAPSRVETKRLKGRISIWRSVQAAKLTVHLTTAVLYQKIRFYRFDGTFALEAYWYSIKDL